MSINQCRAVAACVACAFLFFAPRVQADSEIVVAQRYYKARGVSHPHLYLYRVDGRLLRQLTNDDAYDDVEPIFAPDGETIVFARKAGKQTQYWSVQPLGKDLKQLPSAPAWYTATKSATCFDCGQVLGTKQQLGLVGPQGQRRPMPARRTGRWRSCCNSLKRTKTSMPPEPDRNSC